MANYNSSFTGAEIDTLLTAMSSVPTNYFSLNVTDLETISDGTDFNSLTTVGNYRVRNATSAQTMVNYPVSVAGKVVIFRLYGNNYTGQLVIPATGNTSMYFRYYNNGAWKDWVNLASATINFSNKIVTSDDYLTYFPNGKLEDAEANSIWGIYDTSLFSDAPAGSTNIGAGASSGGMRGTLITLSQAYLHTAVQTGLTQLFVGYRTEKPVFCYRIAIVNNNTYTWSPWSKFEENGFLHSSNTFLYAGHLDETIDDLDDAESNTIYQIDLNLDGSDSDHTLGHHPAPGVSCVVMTYAFSYVSNHGRVQTLYTLDGRCYWRYQYKSGDDYYWTVWNLLRKDLPNIPSAPATNGTYALKAVVSSGSITYSWVAE